MIIDFNVMFSESRMINQSDLIVKLLESYLGE